MGVLIKQMLFAIARIYNLSLLGKLFFSNKFRFISFLVIASPFSCHCEEHSDEAISYNYANSLILIFILNCIYVFKL
jgi:hypothetical protein